LHALRAQGAPPRNVVHALGVTPSGAAISPTDALVDAQSLGLNSALFLAQCLGAQEGAEPLDIWFLSSDMQEVVGEVIVPGKAMLLAPCKVIPLEYPHIRCHSVDIALEGGAPGEHLVEQLAQELEIRSPDRVVAYRASHRWVQTVEPVRLDSPAGLGPRLRERGVYLVTGGLGKIGLTLAEYLAKAARSKLILIQRSPFLPRTEWDVWLGAHPEDDATSRTITRLRAMEASGAEVLVAACDVADLAQMQQVVAEARARFGDIHGVIHSAGVLGDGAVRGKSLSDLERVLSAKVTGTLVLDAIFGGGSLDFFVLFSSLSAIKPGFGQVAYAAANAFVDAFVHSERARRHRWVASLAWDVWQGDGMAYDATAPRALQRLKEEDFQRRGLLPHEGVEVFRRVLASGLPRLLVSTSNYLELLESSDHDLSHRARVEG